MNWKQLFKPEWNKIIIVFILYLVGNLASHYCIITSPLTCQTVSVQTIIFVLLGGWVTILTNHIPKEILTNYWLILAPLITWLHLAYLYTLASTLIHIKGKKK
ncbi:hypothetical protein K8R43_03730 [archaeon]|nr:hypothetical protein [archaeon]